MCTRRVASQITAPECSIPDLGYITKWAFIEGVPLLATVGFLVVAGLLYIKKKFILRRKKGLHSHNSLLISIVFVMFYFMYLSLTRATLEVFNCAPTDPPDGHTYLSVCGRA